MATQEKQPLFMCEDLIVEILTRLPEKDLIQCKCVSKEWLGIISQVCVPRLSVETPVSGLYFRVVQVTEEMGNVSSYSSQDRKQHLLQKVAYDSTDHFIDCAPLEAFPEPSDDNVFNGGVGFAGTSYVSLLPFTHHGADMLDCCNGLLLFVHRPKRQYYVCNPAIRECVPIPLLPPSVHLPSLYASLAFDPSESIHYQVVILSLTTKPQCLHIFHSHTGEWITHEVQVELPSFAKSFRLVRYSVYLKGALYRLSLLNKILRIDLKSINVYLIDFPLRKVPSVQGCIGILNGFLSYANKEDGYLRIWLLKKPSEPSTWILKHNMLFRDMLDRVMNTGFFGVFIWLQPCAFHPKADIIFLGTAHLVLMYHLGSCRVKKVKQSGLKHMHGCRFFSLFTYTRTLVTLKNWCRGTAAKIDGTGRSSIRALIDQIREKLCLHSSQ